ncbi:MAG: tetratricopeptide repeat protein [Pedobacter sp.]|nr:MAG: tetratricopeptide repeat protein [Pedobacter sp.]
MILSMRNLYMLFFVLILPVVGLANGPANGIFNEANKAYAKAQYDVAIKGYQQLVDSGYQSTAVYYNLGNANYKEGNIADAILNYEKALKLDPGNEDIAVNLQFANQKITDKIEAVPEFFLKKWWIGVVMSLTSDAWASIGTTLLLAGFALLIVYLLSTVEKAKRLSFYTGLTFILISVGVLGLANAQKSYFNDRKEAVVFKGLVNVKSAPDDKQKTLFVIHEGTKVKVMENADKWLKVSLPNGSIGWIGSDTVELI